MGDIVNGCIIQPDCTCSDLDDSGIAFEAAYKSLSSKPVNAATLVSAKAVRHIDAYGGEVLMEYSVAFYGGNPDDTIAEDSSKSEFLEAFNENIAGTGASGVALATIYAQVSDGFCVTFSGALSELEDDAVVDAFATAYRTMLKPAGASTILSIETGIRTSPQDGGFQMELLVTSTPTVLDIAVLYEGTSEFLVFSIVQFKEVVSLVWP